MKSLINKFIRSEYIIKLRNFFNIKPIAINTINLNKNISVSDSFLWRTDNNFSTTFNFTDILKIFYGVNDSSFKVIFYDKNYNFLKEVDLKKIKTSNSLLIDKKFLDGLEDYGIFNIFHKSSSYIDSIISNRCYMGFSYKGNLNSFVHGNTYTNFESINGKERDSGIIGTSFMKNNKYVIQNYFEDYKKVELFFTNPTKNKVFFNVNKHSYFLDHGSSKLIKLSRPKRIEIISNCYFLRPLVFTYFNDFIDVFHG